MFQNIRHFFRNTESKVLVSNFLSLSVLQGLNIILPLLTIPFIIKTAELDSFGLISYAAALALFFIVFVEYGFNTITTRDISLHSDNTEETERIYSEVLTSKLFLLLISSVVFSILILSVNSFRENYDIYFLSFLGIIGYTIFPIWLFHGLQKMKYITYINVFFKSIFTICIFIFLKDKTNIWIVPLCTSLGFISSGIASVILVRIKFNIRFRIASFGSVKKQLRNAYHIFISEMYISLIAYSNILILGFFASDAVVGIYASAEKVIRAVGNMISPVVNSLYPHVSKVMQEDFYKGIRFVRQTVKWGRWTILGIIILLFVSADFLFQFINRFMDMSASDLESCILAFRIMIFFPLFSFLDQVYGKLVLIANRKERLFFSVFSICAITNVLMCAILSYKFGYIGTAVSSMATQLFVMLGMYYYAKPLLKKNASV